MLFGARTFFNFQKTCLSRVPPFYAGHNKSSVIISTSLINFMFKLINFCTYHDPSAHICAHISANKVGLS